MRVPGTEDHPVRVAIIGAGPTGFYAAEQLLSRKDRIASVDVFDRLPTPYGLVRYGVAPDHQKIKSVTAVYDRTASHPRFRFFGNVEYGKHLTLEDLTRHYHQIVFCTGAQTDRRLGIPGEDLAGSYPATEFVAWYNGHPDYTDYRFDLSQEVAAVVGIGNVAVDVARILLRSADELARTDIADYALEALRESRIKEVHMLGRRGPAQAAFTNPEIQELTELPNADATARPEEVALDELSRAAVERTRDYTTMKKVEILQALAARPSRGKPRRLVLRFLVSPTALVGSDGHVREMHLVRNRLEATPAGTLVAKPTGETETLPAGLVFRSVGYRGVPLPGIPFNDKWAVILNDKGRVLDPDTQDPLVGLYTAGWIKRGATGVIGTNKPDAAETAANMQADLDQGRMLAPDHPEPEAIDALVRERQPYAFSYADWRKLNEIEVARGRAAGRPRVKFTRIEEMLAALGRT
ncbi:MAG: FAD-dependent oxidoreductase [Armatimonadota bacterium]|nr:FAD-dependent oxidoreductase [Armatimonadota bacterium]MDR7452722.1 FAD-dependent oxidoreductase [Armatimonadota bacterium]MDR7467629.1 FAD-dependent oxidoreductase [Armatimonadota bacterium]MDR7494410.1 FAD-dependent oxidoreductase [Armatimonadota bacterium]MDR7500445.1 FAD-dependent oxidoreductase [Armatimonadota bacterium]